MSPATLKSALIASILGLAVVHAAEPWKILDVDFPDPAVIQTDDGYYAFGTNSGGINAQVAHSTDFQSWTLLDGVDALPGPFPSWVAEGGSPSVWAPDVIQRVCWNRPPISLPILRTPLLDLGRRHLRHVLLRDRP